MKEDIFSFCMLQRQVFWVFPNILQKRSMIQLEDMWTKTSVISFKRGIIQITGLRLWSRAWFFFAFLSLFPLLFSFVFCLVCLFFVFRFIFRLAFYFNYPPSLSNCTAPLNPHCLPCTHFVYSEAALRQGLKFTLLNQLNSKELVSLTLFNLITVGEFQLAFFHSVFLGYNS